MFLHEIQGLSFLEHCTLLCLQDSCKTLKDSETYFSKCSFIPVPSEYNYVSIPQKWGPIFRGEFLTRFLELLGLSETIGNTMGTIIKKNLSRHNAFHL